MSTQVLSTNFAHSKQSYFSSSIDLAGRVGLSSIFALAGISKIQYYELNAQYLSSGGLPEWLLPFVILFELVGALLITIGFQTRIAALGFAGFSALTALLYHNNLSDQIQFLMFFKNIAIAGGFLILAAHGPGKFSIDSRFSIKH